MTNPNDPAFSRAPAFSPDCGTMDGAEGLSKREEFAKAAMQGLLAGKHGFTQPSGEIRSDPAMFANAAVTAADALIAELNKEVK